MKTLLHKRWGITLIALVYSALWGFAYPTVKMTMESFAVVASGILLGEDVLELRASGAVLVGLAYWFAYAKK